MMTEQQPQPQPRLQIPCFWKHILEAAEIKFWFMYICPEKETNKTIHIQSSATDVCNS